MSPLMNCKLIKKKQKELESWLNIKKIVALAEDQFSSQHPHDGQQLSITQVPDDKTPKATEHVCCTNIYAGEAFTHIMTVHHLSNGG